jgi:hypothetical protein
MTCKLRVLLELEEVVLWKLSQAQNSSIAFYVQPWQGPPPIHRLVGLGYVVWDSAEGIMFQKKLQVQNSCNIGTILEGPINTKVDESGLGGGGVRQKNGMCKKWKSGGAKLIFGHYEYDFENYSGNDFTRHVAWRAT